MLIPEHSKFTKVLRSYVFVTGMPSIKLLTAGTPILTPNSSVDRRQCETIYHPMLVNLRRIKSLTYKSFWRQLSIFSVLSSIECCTGHVQAMTMMRPPSPRPVYLHSLGDVAPYRKLIAPPSISVETLVQGS